jgi:ribosomal-protein-alanine N-acetyltransferase
MNRPETKISIVPATMVHGNVISVLHGASFDEGWSPFTVRQVLNMPGAFGLVAVSEGHSVPEPDLAGFVLARAAAGECEILSIAVGEAWRGLGIGRSLMEAAIAAARAAGAESLFLEVAEDNEAAQALYRGFGFAPVGRRRDYYKRANGPPVAALTFFLRLDS